MRRQCTISIEIRNASQCVRNVPKCYCNVLKCLVCFIRRILEVLGCK
nr:MAG TPA: hypothetical protein [Caudoviricetes sp.]DAM71118.1 MAG TPA: hypothetical protein [Caudoviricetes sp.]